MFLCQRGKNFKEERKTYEENGSIDSEYGNDGDSYSGKCGYGKCG